MAVSRMYDRIAGVSPSIAFHMGLDGVRRLGAWWASELVQRIP